MKKLWKTIIIFNSTSKKQKSKFSYQPSILITAFKGRANSSSILLRNIQTDKVLRLELTNSFIASEKELKNTIKENNLKYIMAFGQKPRINEPIIEMAAHKNNKQIKTTFPTKKFQEFLMENQIKTILSNNAGKYLCNNIYYYGQKYIKDNSLKTKMIFMHLPTIKTNYNFNKLAKTISDYILIRSIWSIHHSKTTKIQAQFFK